VCASGIGRGNAVARDIRLAEMLIARRAQLDPAVLADAATSLKSLLAGAPLSAPIRENSAITRRVIEPKAVIREFRYEPKPARVLFGAGRLSEVAAAVKELGSRRALVLSTANHRNLADMVVECLGTLAAGIFSGAVMHTPANVTETAMERVRGSDADCVIAIGGGSTIGLGKAIALRTGLPQVAIPTTYAGSEMTDILGETKDGAKTTQRSLQVLPETVIYDVELTLTLPARTSAMSGMNAIAHAVEALYARDGNPIIALMAEEGIESLAASLPRIMTDPGNREARSMAQYGAWLCGTCLGSVSMALHHKLCHVLGGSFNLPHAETHSVMLPYALAYNSGAASEAMTVIARALREDDAVLGLHRLKERLVGSLSLRDIGMPEDGIDRAAAAACANPYWNPRPIELNRIRELISNAYHGAANVAT
jgi:alcohol dehydrogenase class IV